MPTARAQIDFSSIENRPRRVTPNVIRAVCDRIVENVRPEKIVLFGSYAKGAATKDSDLDLLVIVDDTNSLASLTRRDRYGEVLRLFRHRGFGLDVIVMTNKELEKIIAENEGEWKWFRKAEHELKFLEHSPFDAEDPPTDEALRDDCVVLTRYKLEMTYPGDHVPEEVPLEEAKAAIEKARRIKNFVMEKAKGQGY